uniref:uncharacterized protein LOC120339396 n=1 Tax=Styela clava TaxID=7725 RepID=UPI001939E779|nr:uncharacterized protein LOC120339396 [Styela clava]
MFEDVDAVTDVPSCYFWEEIHKAFPDAKIILTLRENDEVWPKSFKNQMKTSNGNTMVTLLSYLSPTFQRSLFDIGFAMSPVIFGLADMRHIAYDSVNGDMLKLKYRAHNAHVMQNAPPDKLLVYKVTEGWYPLCKFLGVPVPDKPFPHKNKGGAMIEEHLKSDPIVQKMKREMMVSSILCTAFLGLGVYFIYKRGI